MQGYDSIGNASQASSPSAGWMLLFAGQGVPAPGMGNQVCDISPVTTHVWDCASDISGIDIRQLCRKGPMTHLTKTRFQQLAVTTVSVATLAWLRQQHALPEAGFAGHSVGEYAALHAAGVMDLETLFRAVDQRAQIMQQLAEQKKGGMYAIKSIHHEALHQLITHDMGLADQVRICCDNGQQQVVGGEMRALKTLIHHLTRQGKETIKLAVNGAWHSPLMAQGVNKMRTVLTGLSFTEPRLPVTMNTSGRVENDIDTIKENLALHLTHTVRWRESMDCWQQMGYCRFMEVNHRRILTPLLQAHYQHSENNQFHHCGLLLQDSQLTSKEA